MKKKKKKKKREKEKRIEKHEASNIILLRNNDIKYWRGNTSFLLIATLSHPRQASTCTSNFRERERERERWW
jgi:hypothetical protein